MNEFAEILNLFIANVIALLLTCGDSEDWSKIYDCTTDYQQATIVFDVAADTVRMCPGLNRQVKILASQMRIVYQPTNSFYQALSAEPNSSTILIFIVSYSMSCISSQPVNTLTLWPSVPEMQERSRFTFLSPLLEQDTNSICYETHPKGEGVSEYIKQNLGEENFFKQLKPNQWVK